MKKNVHNPGHFQYTIHFEGNSFFVHGHKKDLPYIKCIFHLFKYVVKLFLVSATLHHISLLRLLPKSNFKISTFQPNFLCSSSFNFNTSLDNKFNLLKIQERIFNLLRIQERK